MYSNAVGGIKVVVREEDYEAAADILDFPAEETQEPAEEVQPRPTRIPVPHCPSCGLTTVAVLPKLRVFVSLAVLLCGVGVAVERLDLAALTVAVVGIVAAVAPRHRCTSCGKTFTWKREPPGIAPSPLPEDLIEEHCPRCGSPEIHRQNYRRFKAWTLFEPLTLLAVLWPFLRKRKCDNCGLTV